MNTGHKCFIDKKETVLCVRVKRPGGSGGGGKSTVVSFGVTVLSRRRGGEKTAKKPLESSLQPEEGNWGYRNSIVTHAETFSNGSGTSRGKNFGL